MVIGTVKGYQHDIGKNIVVMMIEDAGFRVIDLGVDVETDRSVSAARENKAEIVALSALLTTTMLAMEISVACHKGKGPGCQDDNWESSSHGVICTKDWC